MSRSSVIGRIAAIVALVIAVVALVVMLSGGDDYEVTAEFENASQLVTGNQVVVGGVAVGSVSSIELGPSGQAEVTFSVDDDYSPLRRGTVATVRSPSLSQIAGRQVQLTIPPDSEAGAPIPDGGTLSEQETFSAVDLDQLFNTLSPRTINDFKHVIEGLSTSYDGIGPRANRGIHYLNPFLSTSRQVFGELSSDQRTFENLIVDTSSLSIWPSRLPQNRGNAYLAPGALNSYSSAKNGIFPNFDCKNTDYATGAAASSQPTDEEQILPGQSVPGVNNGDPPGTTPQQFAPCYIQGDFPGTGADNFGSGRNPELFTDP